MPNINLNYSGNDHGPRVAIIGDSITRMATPELEAQLEPSYQINIQFGVGRDIHDMLPTLAAQLSDPGRPVAVVENLGTNDGLHNNRDWLADFNAMIHILDHSRIGCVILTTISTVPERMKAADGYYKNSNAAVVDGLNSEIQSVAGANPHFHIVDWNSAATGPNALDYFADGVHPSTTTAHAVKHPLLADETGVFEIAHLDRIALGECIPPMRSIPHAA